MRTEWTLRGGLFVAALLMAPALARAAEPSRVDIAVAKKLFDEASEAEAAERWQEAREKLGRVLAIKETAGVRFHFANAEERTGLLLAAKRDYRRAAELADSLPEPDRGTILRLSSTALAALEPKIPTVTLAVAASQATVTVDGQSIERASLGTPIPHELGEIKIAASAPGYEPFEKSLILLAGDHPTVEVALRPIALAPVSPPPPVATTKAPPPTETPRRSSTAGYLAAGAGLVLAGGATYFFLKRSSLESETSDVCGRAYEICDQTARDARAAQYRNYAIVGVAGAVVAAGAATYLFLRTPRDSVSASAGPTSVSLRVRF